MSVEKYQQFIKGQLDISGSDFFSRQRQEYDRQQTLWKQQQRQQSVVAQQKEEEEVSLS